MQEKKENKQEKKDYLFDDMFDREMEITEAVKNNISNKKIRKNFSIANGMFYTDAEKEQYIRESLERELP